ncbi:mobilization protein [Streptomyces sp. WAC 06738]|uniref:relaxase/mobilization nuclease domain-containing protein n=1 Tax=Streptomyces sp. WAC 06738 TaxID=2203210 RepID=UPI001F0C3E28|nr:mobilization protein [Streptomyces sp. WAC 06738]
MWHCAIRAAPEDPILTDEQWAQVARRIVHATGIAPTGDPDGCRWIAARHADDHIHIVATKMRDDLRRPRHWNDYHRADTELAKIETEWGLRAYDRGDRTAAKRPTRAETEKATRRTGSPVTPREKLRATVRTAAAHATSEDHFFALLAGADILVDKRIAPSGDTIGYKVALAGDTNAAGDPIWFAGGKLAPDLSLPKIRARLTSQPSDTPTTRQVQPAERWRHTTTALRNAHRTLHENSSPSAAQAELAAASELLDILPALTTGPARRGLFAAAQTFERATRSAIRFDYAQAAELRTSAKHLLRTAGQPIPDAPALDLLLTLTLLTIAAARWHRAQRHTQQAAAARATLPHLRAAYRHTAAPALDNLTQRAPAPAAVDRYDTLVRMALPEHAEQILTDGSWPALAATLHEAESDGRRPADALAKAADSRELDTADSVAEVLIWRLHNTRGVQPRRAEGAQTRITTRSRTEQRQVQAPDNKRLPTPSLSPERARRQR